jgi:hypothetical protein
MIRDIKGNGSGKPKGEMTARAPTSPGEVVRYLSGLTGRDTRPAGALSPLKFTYEGDKTVDPSSTRTVLIPWRNQPTYQNPCTLLFAENGSQILTRQCVKACKLSADVLALADKTECPTPSTHVYRIAVSCRDLQNFNAKGVRIWAHPSDRGLRTPSNYGDEAYFTELPESVVACPENWHMVFGQFGLKEESLRSAIDAKVMRLLTCRSYQESFEDCGRDASSCWTGGHCKQAREFVSCNIFLLQCIAISEMLALAKWLNTVPRSQLHAMRIATAIELDKEKFHLRAYAELQNRYIRNWITDTCQTGCSLLAHQDDVHAYGKPSRKRRHDSTPKVKAAFQWVGARISSLPSMADACVAFGHELCDLCGNYCDHISGDCLLNLQCDSVWDVLAARYVETVRADIVTKIRSMASPIIMNQMDLSLSCLFPAAVRMMADYVIMLPSLVCLLDVERLRDVPNPASSAAGGTVSIRTNKLVSHMTQLQASTSPILMSLAIDHLRTVYQQTAASSLRPIDEVYPAAPPPYLPYLTDALWYVQGLAKQARAFGWLETSVDWINFTRVAVSSLIQLDIQKDLAEKVASPAKPVQGKSTMSPSRPHDSIALRLDRLGDHITHSFKSAVPLVGNPATDIRTCCSMTETVLQVAVTHNDFILFCVLQGCSKFCCLEARTSQLRAAAAHFTKTLHTPPALTAKRLDWMEGRGGMFPPDPEAVGLEAILLQRPKSTMSITTTRQYSRNFHLLNPLEMCTSIRLRREQQQPRLPEQASIPTILAALQRCEYELPAHNAIPGGNLSALAMFAEWRYGVDVPGMLLGLPMGSGNRFLFDTVNLEDLCQDMAAKHPPKVLRVGNCRRDKNSPLETDRQPSCLTSVLVTVFSALLHECWKASFELTAEYVSCACTGSARHLMQLQTMLQDALSRVVYDHVSQTVIVLIPRSLCVYLPAGKLGPSLEVARIIESVQREFVQLLPCAAAMFVCVCIDKK